MRHINTKKVKTRKEHICIGCSRKFPKGTKMQINTYESDGIKSDYWCKTCQKNFDKYMLSDDLFLPGELKEGEGWEEIRKEIEGN